MASGLVDFTRDEMETVAELLAADTRPVPERAPQLPGSATRRA